MPTIAFPGCTAIRILLWFHYTVIRLDIRFQLIVYYGICDPDLCLLNHKMPKVRDPVYDTSSTSGIHVSVFFKSSEKRKGTALWINPLAVARLDCVYSSLVVVSSTATRWVRKKLRMVSKMKFSNKGPLASPY